MANDKGIEFLKNRIKAKLSAVADQMGKYQYKLAIALVDDCKDFEELKEMAELSLQMDFFSYVKDEIDPLLNEMNLTIADVRKLGIGEIPSSYNPEMFELDPSEIDDSLDDEDTTNAIAMMLFSRITNEAAEEKYRQEILDFQLEEHPTEADVDAIEMDDDELEAFSSDEEESEDEEDDIIDEEELEGFFSDMPEDEEVETGTMDTDEIFDDSVYDDMEDDEDTEEEQDVDDIFIDDDELGTLLDEEEDEFDIDESELFGDDEDISDDSSEDEDDTFDPFDDSSTSDIDSLELDGDYEDDEDADSQIDNLDLDDDINIDDDSDLDPFGEDDSDPFSELDESDFEDYDGDITDDSPESDGFDIEDDELIEDQIDSEDTDDDPFSDIDEEDLAGFSDSDDSTEEDDPFSEIDIDDIGVIDDSDDFFAENTPKADNAVKTPANAVVHTEEKPTRATGIRPETVYRNGTVQGNKTQDMFDIFNNISTKSVKLASAIKKKASQAYGSKFFDINA